MDRAGGRAGGREGGEGWGGRKKSNQPVPRDGLPVSIFCCFVLTRESFPPLPPGCCGTRKREKQERPGSARGLGHRIMYCM